MYQEIITYLIVIASFGYVFVKFYKFAKKFFSKSIQNPCSSCSKGSCEACPFAGQKFDFKAIHLK